MDVILIAHAARWHAASTCASILCFTIASLSTADAHMRPTDHIRDATVCCSCYRKVKCIPVSKLAEHMQNTQCACLVASRLQT